MTSTVCTTSRTTTTGNGHLGPEGDRHEKRWQQGERRPEERDEHRDGHDDRRQEQVGQSEDQPNNDCQDHLDRDEDYLRPEETAEGAANRLLDQPELL